MSTSWSEALPELATSPTIESRRAQDDNRKPRISERGYVPSRADETRDPNAWMPVADFDDDIYADVPCTD